MTRSSPAAVAFAIALLSAAAPSAAAPSRPQNDDARAKQACVDAATRGQIQRDDGKLGAAEEAFSACSEAACPAAVRRSCTEWLADVRARRPSLVAEPPDGVAPERVRVVVDGEAITLGARVVLEPGPHVAEVTVEGEAPFKVPFELAEREAKVLHLERPAPPAPPEAPPPARPESRPIPLGVWVLGGVALAGAASFATFGVLARSETDDLMDRCAPVCTGEQRDGALRTAIVADVSLGVAVVAAAVATYLFVARPSRPASAAAPAAGFSF